MACDCIEVMDAKLATMNHKLMPTMVFPRDGTPGYLMVHITVEKVETRKRGQGVNAIPTFCPFCGVRYMPEPDASRTGAAP